ncbi:hypothetical protein B0H14DRAFT_3634992 [Mycena olivaceomarginata]|nr:hypothetical protein B0H14DRAFT_3634992 [Mycena olivaceomarginata]
MAKYLAHFSFTSTNTIPFLPLLVLLSQSAGPPPLGAAAPSLPQAQAAASGSSAGFFALQVISKSAPSRSTTKTHHYYSAIRPEANPEIDCHLPRVMVELCVYKENLKGVIQPSVYSIEKAMQTYARQGGTSSIFVHDDGLQLDVDERAHRIAFYAEHDNGPGGFKRIGNFKVSKDELNRWQKHSYVSSFSILDWWCLGLITKRLHVRRIFSLNFDLDIQHKDDMGRHRVRGVIGTQLFWILLTVAGEVITTSTVVWYMIQHQLRQKRIQADITLVSVIGADDQLAHANFYRNTILRIVAYPITSALINLTSVACVIHDTRQDSVHNWTDYHVLLLGE